MPNIKTLSPEELRRMQMLMLDMLVEFDRVCRKHDISYVIVSGTLLGAVRHKGFIPWDDDADVAMLREDYERFKKVRSELNPEICWFQDHDTEPEYCWGYGKLRRTGTTYVRAGQEHLKFETGVFVDVFPMDDIPLTTPGQMLQDFYCFCLRKILYSEVGRYVSKGGWKLLYSALSCIPISFVFRRLSKMTAKSRNDSPNLVRVLTFTAMGKLYRQDSIYGKSALKWRYGMPKEWFKERTEYEFEGKKLYGPKDSHAFLTHNYGDYMTPPPEKKRTSHAPVSDYSF